VCVRARKKHPYYFINALEKFRKATISSYLSVRPSICLSVCMEQLSSHWTDFHEIWHLSIFRKSVQPIQDSLNSDKNNGYFKYSPVNFPYHTRLMLRTKNASETVAEKIKTHVLTSIFFFRDRTGYGITWKNTVESDSPQITRWLIGITCWIPKTTDIHLEYVLLFAFPPKQSLHERASMSRYTYVTCLFILSP
jgi:hypothetical protein